VGRPGLAEAPSRLGGDDGTGSVSDAARLVALVSDRVRTWADHAPDPDRPLLTGIDPRPHRRPGRGEPPTKWWVYAAIRRGSCRRHARDLRPRLGN